ncbi:MAG TPA: hypothetical protein VGN49_15020 [Micrococcaceae bacterium]|jgi:hypothetical protein|nr:hypothetical protein [Micrococcaceae bacterium]
MAGPAVRILEASRAVYGLCQLSAPTLLADRMGLQLDGAAQMVVRVLGGRHLLQAALVGGSPSGRRSGPLHGAAATVDFLHAASMVLLAAADERRRKAALLDAAVAGVFGAAEVRAGLQTGHGGGLRAGRAVAR